MPRVVDDLQQAVQALVAGRLVAMPTETVYGLSARADDDEAVREVFRAKGRPADHPLIVHVADREAVSSFSEVVSDAAAKLMQTFWPGPLTVILPRTSGVAGAAAGGLPTVGLRCPDHPLTLQLLTMARQHGVPGLAAPSANRFGRVSPTQAEHVLQEFPGMDLVILDGGPCRVGIESTIVDCTTALPTLLRPGQISRSAIEAVLGQALGVPGAQSAKTSGTLEAHYAPSAKLRVMSPEQMSQALSALGGLMPAGLAVYSTDAAWEAHPEVIFRRRPVTPETLAHELFATLRDFDNAGAKVIWVESPPEGEAWDGVRDRLRRAQASA